MPAGLHVVAGKEEWRAAVAAVDGRQLVLAGPGTGKTEFLAQRAARLVDAGVPPSHVAVLTFSRRAASELDARIGAHLHRPASGLAAATFHGYALRLLEARHAAAGRPMPLLLTGPEQVQLVGELLATERPADWPRPFRPLLTTATFAAEVADFVMRCHERSIGPVDLTELAEDRDDWRPLPSFLTRYRAALDDRKRLDYGVLVVEAAAAARENAPVTHVLVDEYQDTSPAQALLAEALAGDAGNLTVSADPHQSIYSFRGAEVGNVIAFGRRQPSTVYQLVQSFRVPAAILASAERLVAPSPELPQRAIQPAPHAGTVTAHLFDQRSAEAEWVASEVERLYVTERLPLASMAILLRSTRNLLPELLRALDRRGIDHDRPDTRLVDHPAIRIIHDLVTAATSADTVDADAAMRRILLGPLLRLPLGIEREMVRSARRDGTSWPEIIRTRLPRAADLADLLDDPSWATDGEAVAGFWHVWDRLPGLEALVADPARKDFRAAWTLLARTLERLAERDPRVDLATYLATAAGGDFEASPLLSFARPRQDRLVVTTLHQAKGLEFDVVFIVDATEGVFPTARRSTAILQGDALSGPQGPLTRLAEERRLAYTATTRARRAVTWTATTAGIDDGELRPSRFLLAATGATSFADLGPPIAPQDSDEFVPLTVADAEARLRRMLADPTSSAVDRLSALMVLVESPTLSPSSFAGVAEPGPDTGLVTPGIRLSPTQATAYEECPRRYALERRVRAVAADSPHLRFGALMHLVLEDAERSAAESGRPRADETIALQHLDRVWQEMADFGSPAANEGWRRRGREFLSGFYSDWRGVDSPPVALELELDAEIGGVSWRGRVDRVDPAPGGIKLVDYKTSKTRPTIGDVAHSLQLGYYTIAAADSDLLQDHGPQVSAELWYPLLEGRSVFAFEAGAVDSVRERLETAAAGILAEDWTPRLGAHCARCPVRLVCPAWPEGREG